MFETILDNDENGIVKCKTCSCQFDWDVHSEINLEFNDRKHCLQLVCPGCKQGACNERHD